MTQATEPIVYQGQFGDFIVDADDRREVVIIYRAGLAVAAGCFAIATGLACCGKVQAALSWISLALQSVLSAWLWA